MSEEIKEKTSKSSILVRVFIVLFVAIMIAAVLTPKETTQSIKYGVKVVSEIPLENLQRVNMLTINNDSRTNAELTCKFELSAISTPGPSGYQVEVAEGDFGIYIGEKKAVIKGETQNQILTACHAFACLLDGIECPNDFLDIEDFISDKKAVSVILDENVGGAGGRGYAEIIGALSFYQSKNADKDGNGLLTQDEIDKNDFEVYPFLKSGENCLPQPYNNLLQNWNGSDESINCDEIGAQILIQKSDRGVLSASEQRITLEGSNDQIHTMSILLRDIISPEMVRRIYGFK